MSLRRRLLTAAEAAELVDVTPATIRQWKSRGKLTAFDRQEGVDLFLDVDVYDAKKGARVGCAAPPRLSQS